MLAYTRGTAKIKYITHIGLEKKSRRQSKHLMRELSDVGCDSGGSEACQ